MRSEGESQSTARRVALIAAWIAGGAVAMVVAHRLLAGNFDGLAVKAIIGGVIGLVMSPVGWLGRGKPLSHDD